MVVGLEEEEKVVEVHDNSGNAAESNAFKFVISSLSFKLSAF